MMPALPGWLWLAAVVAGTLVVYLVLFRALFRFGWRSSAARHLRDRVRWPAGATTMLLAALVGLPLAGLSPVPHARVRHGLLIAIVVTVAWLLDRLLRVVEDTTADRLDLDARDNLVARRRLTRVRLIRRVGTTLIVILAVAAVLLTFDQARSVGASLLASAGLLGLVAGVAARPTLANLMAGMQVAFTEPIRLDDVVVVEGEWGRVEEITLAYVVVQLWDRRRMVLPTSYFTDQPFQNWTRRQAQIIGPVSLYLDYRAPVGRLRRELDRLLEGSEHWDGDVAALQVVDTTETTIQVRALASAEDAPTAWDLRCEVREGLIDFLRREHPEALPVRRLEGSGTGEPRPAADSVGRPDGGGPAGGA